MDQASSSPTPGAPQTGSAPRGTVVFTLDRRFWCLNAVAWSLLALTNSTAVAADLLRAGREFQGFHLVAFYLATYAPWFLITPAVFKWVERFPPAGASWPRLLLRYLPMSVPWLLFYVPTQSAIGAVARHGSLAHFFTAMRSMPINQWVVDGVYLIALVGVAATAHQVREARRRESEATALAIENAGLSARLSEARLEMLRAQLEPHFLYNALNSITALIRQAEAEKAVEAVGLLSELLRYATRATDRDRVLLSEEIDFAEAYWGFQGVRYGERLSFRFDISPDVLDGVVPPLILQPLLENAIRHGVEAIEAPSQVALVARRAGGDIELLVSNHPGQPGRDSGGLGVGLRNIRERLRWLYGHTVEVGLEDHDGTFTARLLLPAMAPGKV